MQPRSRRQTIHVTRRRGTGDNELEHREVPHGSMRDVVLAERVDALQEDVHGLQRDITGIRTSMGTMATASAVAMVSEDVRRLSDRLTTTTQPNWPVLLGTITVCLSFIAMIGGLSYLLIQQQITASVAIVAQEVKANQGSITERVKAAEVDATEAKSITDRRIGQILTDLRDDRQTYVRQPEFADVRRRLDALILKEGRASARD